MSEKKDFLQEGTILKDRFKIVKYVSKGRNSNLYIVEDRKKFGMLVLKELKTKSDNPVEAKQAYQQFELQARILNELDHPQLPKIEDFFEENSNHFLVMEYLEGKNFDELIKTSQDFFPENHVIDWGIQLCEVLYYLHSHTPPIIFRDLKPEHVILTKDNKVKLVNFGISKVFDSQSRTLAVAKIINPHFSPIEQYAMVTDARCDIYSLGATLYYIVTKTLPVDAMERTMQNIPLKFCREFNKSISFELEGIILKAMELDKEDRYQNANEMMDALKEIKTSTVTESIFEESPSPSVISTIQIKESDTENEAEPFGEEHPIPEIRPEKEDIPEEEPIRNEEDEVNDIEDKPEPKKVSRKARKRGFLTRLIEWIMGLFGSKRKD